MKPSLPLPPLDPSAEAADFVGLALSSGSAVGATCAGFVEMASWRGPDGPGVVALVDGREVGRGSPSEVAAALAGALHR